MSKTKGGTGSKWLVVEDEKLNEVITMLVEFAEEKKIHPKLVAAAMGFISKKIQAHLRIEIKDVHDLKDTIH